MDYPIQTLQPYALAQPYSRVIANGFAVNPPPQVNSKGETQLQLTAQTRPIQSFVPQPNIVSQLNPIPSLSANDRFRPITSPHQAKITASAQPILKVIQSGKILDEAGFKAELQKIHQQKLMPEVEAHITQQLTEWAKEANTAYTGQYTGLVPWIKSHYHHNPFSKVFKAAACHELMDMAQYGENRYSASAWQYRLAGTRKAFTDFVSTVKEFPIMSLGVIGAFSYLGHRYPFIGGVSGALIIAWGTGATLVDEILSAKAPKTDRAHQAEHWVDSGENMTATLLTLLGIKGIRNGILNGLKEAETAGKALPKASTAVQSAKNFLNKAKAAITATVHEKYETNIAEKVLFLSGLIDDVLLPFNALGKWLQSMHAEKTISPGGLE